MTRSFDIFFDLRLIKRSNKHREAGDLRSHRAHYDITVMLYVIPRDMKNELSWDQTITLTAPLLNHHHRHHHHHHHHNHHQHRYTIDEWCLVVYLCHRNIYRNNGLFSVSWLGYYSSNSRGRWVVWFCIDVLINIFIIWDYGENMENKNFTVNTWIKWLCVGGNRSIILCKHT